MSGKETPSNDTAQDVDAANGKTACVAPILSSTCGTSFTSGVLLIDELP